MMRLLVLFLSPLVLATTATTQRAVTPRPGVSVDVDDARRAAAVRLLSASRFRERQGLQLPDSLSAARADLTAECVDLASAGLDLRACRATATPDAATRARLSTAQPLMLDEVMAASQTVYARRFTAAEMDEITRFFRSPVGRKYAIEYSRVIDEVQARRRVIARRYLVDAARRGRAG